MRVALDFNESKHVKIKLTQTQKRLIRRMYKQSFEEIKKNLEKLQIYDNISSKANEVVLREMAESIKDEYRNSGFAKELLQECEKWAKEKGCQEFASDCELTNITSLKFHLAVGFEETNRIICFKKKI